MYTQINERFVKSKTRVGELKGGMVIHAYCRFARRYRNMDEITCEFVRHNFRGTRCVVVRGRKKLRLPVQEIRQGDSLVGIYEFPPELRKITIVTEELKQALKHRGMLEFITVSTEAPKPVARDLDDLLRMVVAGTEEPVSGRPRPRRSNGRAAALVNKLVDGVQQSLPVRSQTVGAIEEEMDLARRGRLSIREIAQNVREIIDGDCGDALVAIASLKTSQRTYDHCVDVGAIFQAVYPEIQRKRKKRGVFRDRYQTMLGGFLHDFGKSAVPKKILESREPFSKNGRAMQVIRTHPEHGARQLAALNMPDCIVNLARFHHVKANNVMLTSYPQDCDPAEVSFEARLLAIIDIYQALVGTRNYQKSWSPPATMRYLDALAGVEIDQQAWDLFLREMGVYPKGSLVELNDGSLGFVMTVPGEGQDLMRPVVAVIRNGKGEDLSHHSLLDLQVERDMSITRDVDRAACFGENALGVFTGITV